MKYPEDLPIYSFFIVLWVLLFSCLADSNNSLRGWRSPWWIVIKKLFPANIDSWLICIDDDGDNELEADDNDFSKCNVSI